MESQPPNPRANLLDTLRSGTSSIRDALSQLATRKKSKADPPAATPPQKPVPEGPRWGQLVLLDKVGEGAFGEVYRAWDIVLEREVALKLLHAADEDPALLQEARMLARLRHPNVVTVYGVDRHEGRSGIWMDFIEGDTLASLVDQRGSFGAQEALLVGIDVCGALAAAHQSGLLHRDIKAQNVMRERGGRIVLMDFGLGHETAGGDPSDFGGTPLYMAPELLDGASASIRSDVYAVGVLLFHLVTRSYPVEGATLAELRRQHAEGEARPLRDLRPDLPSSFSRAVQKSLARDPAGRYGSAGQMAMALEAAFGRRGFTLPISRRAFWWSAASASAAGGAAFWWREHLPNSKVAEGASLLVSEISNATGDTQLNAVADVLRVQLAQSAHFNLLDGDRVREKLREMTRPPDQKLDVPVAREVALRSGTPVIVYGTISPLGAGYGLSLVMERIEGQPRTPVATESKLFEATSKNAMFDAIHQAANWIRKGAGEATKDISANDVQPEEATTSNWQALDDFAKGERSLTPAHMAEAVTLYKQAVSADPDFVLALARLAQAESFLQHKIEAFVYWRKAVDALEKRAVTRRENFRIRGMRSLTQEDYPAAEQAMGMFASLYPADPLSHHYHAEALRNLDRLDEAYRELKASSKLRRTDVTLNNLVSVGLLLGRFDETSAYLREMKPAAAAYYGSLAQFLQRDYSACDQNLLRAIRGDDARLRSSAYAARASLLAELGRTAEARSVLDEGIAADVATGNATGHARKLLANAYLHLSSGDNTAARALALEAAARDRDTACLWRAGSLLAEAGFAVDAQRVLSQIESPDEGSRYTAARAIVSAEIELAAGRISNALTAFARADQSAPPIRPRDYLARALQRAGRLDEAQAAWRRIADRPALVWVPQPDSHVPGLWSEALVRVAELSLPLGRFDQGRAALALFFKLREHADANAPLTVLARKLQTDYAR